MALGLKNMAIEDAHPDWRENQLKHELKKIRQLVGDALGENPPDDIPTLEMVKKLIARYDAAMIILGDLDAAEHEELGSRERLRLENEL